MERDESDTNGAVLGIDPGFSEREPTTCLCLLIWNESSVSFDWELTGSTKTERRSALEHLVPAGTHLQAVAIDGPLTHDLVKISRYRSAEALLSQGVFQKRGKPGQTSSPNGKELHAHASTFAKLVLEMESDGVFSIADASHFRPIHEKSIIEAFPSQFLGALVPEEQIPKLNRDASDRYWEILVDNGRLDDLVSTLLPGRAVAPPFRRSLGHEHHDGVICALTALSVACCRCVGVGDSKDGYIYLPPSDIWGRAQNHDGSWMARALKESLPKVQATRRPDHQNHQLTEVIRFDNVWFPRL